MNLNSWSYGQDTHPHVSNDRRVIKGYLYQMCAGRDSHSSTSQLNLCRFEH